MRNDSNAARRAEAMVIVAAALLALVLRVWALHARGVLDYDETYYYILGRNLLTGRGYTLNGLPHTAFPPLYPILAGLSSLVWPAVRWSTSSVSAVAGALVVVPVYYLGREVGGRRTGAIAAAVAAAWPALFFLAARSVTYSQRLYAGSEPLFVTLMATGILFFWTAWRRGAWWRAALFGAFLGLAALTRDEGAVFFAVLWAWLLLAQLLKRRRRARAIPAAAAALAGFLIIFGPWLARVWIVTGSPGTGSKLANFTHTRPALWKWVFEGDAGDYVKFHYRLNDDATWMADAYWGVGAWHLAREGESSLSAGLELVSDPQWQWLPVFGVAMFEGKAPIVPESLYAFVAAGILLMLSKGGGRSFALLFAVFLAIHAVMGVTLYVLPRLLLVLVPFLAVFAAAGLDFAAGHFARLAGNLGHPLRERAAAFLYALPVAAAVLLMCRGGILANIDGNRGGVVFGAVSSSNYDRAVADELARRLPADSTLMCNKPWIAVWADMRWRVSPAEPPERIATYAGARGIDYAILGRWQVGLMQPGTPLYPYLAGEIPREGAEMLFDFRAAGGGI